MLKFLLVVPALLCAPALAQTSAVALADASAEKTELDRIVCERQEQLGSRLGGRKVCKTIREWQEERRVQREETEGVQRGMNGEPAGLATIFDPGG